MEAQCTERPIDELGSNYSDVEHTLKTALFFSSQASRKHDFKGLLVRQKTFYINHNGNDILCELGKKVTTKN